MSGARSREPTLAEESAIAAAGGRCRCRGECGRGHGWLPDSVGVECRAPQGSRVVPLRANPGYWQLWGPSYPELYDLDQVVEVKLTPVERGGRRFAACQRCAALSRKRR